VAQVVSNLVSFAVLTLLLRNQIAAVDRMTDTFESLRTSQELVIQLSTLDNIHRGLFPNTSWLRPADMPGAAADLASLTTEFTEHHTASFKATGQGRLDA
jgi:hypothetical protein